MIMPIHTHSVYTMIQLALWMVQLILCGVIIRGDIKILSL